MSIVIYIEIFLTPGNKFGLVDHTNAFDPLQEHMYESAGLIISVFIRYNNSQYTRMSMVRTSTQLNRIPLMLYVVQEMSEKNVTY